MVLVFWNPYISQALVIEKVRSEVLVILLSMGEKSLLLGFE
jgi:hypothetical protein